MTDRNSTLRGTSFPQRSQTRRSGLSSWRRTAGSPWRCAPGFQAHPQISRSSRVSIAVTPAIRSASPRSGTSSPGIPISSWWARGWTSSRPTAPSSTGWSNQSIRLRFASACESTAPSPIPQRSSAERLMTMPAAIRRPTRRPRTMPSSRRCSSRQTLQTSRNPSCAAGPATAAFPIRSAGRSWFPVAGSSSSTSTGTRWRFTGFSGPSARWRRRGAGVRGRTGSA